MAFNHIDTEQSHTPQHRRLSEVAFQTNQVTHCFSIMLTRSCWSCGDKAEHGSSDHDVQHRKPSDLSLSIAVYKRDITIHSELIQRKLLT